MGRAAGVARAFLEADLLMMIFLEAIEKFEVDLCSEEMKGRDCPTGRARNLYTQILRQYKTWKCGTNENFYWYKV